jgi:NADH:ubiquinone oxidoreductase subunit 4 (subunit M)
LHLTPNLGIAIILMIVFFAGLPGTIKFISEFYLFSAFFEISPLMCILLMFLANVLGLIGFSKCWFNSIFGINLNYRNFNILDLTYKEILIISFSLFFLFIFIYYLNLFYIFFYFYNFFNIYVNFSFSFYNLFVFLFSFFSCLNSLIVFC